MRGCGHGEDENVVVAHERGHFHTHEYYVTGTKIQYTCSSHELCGAARLNMASSVMTHTYD